MNQIVEQTREEKVAMYMKLPKRQLVEMLIESNEVNAALPSYTEVQVCDSCHKHPNVLYYASSGRYCHGCLPKPVF